MSQIKVNEIYDASGGSAAKLYGSSMRYGGTAFVNRIINGDMRIDQRNVGAAVTPSAASSYTIDRFNYVGTQASKMTIQQVTDAPAGFTNSVKLTVASAATPTAPDQFRFNQPLEGFNTADFGWGTANAQAATISFRAKTSIAGTYSVALWNGANGRSYVTTVALTTSWAAYSFTVPGDTTGTWDTGNGVGIELIFDLGGGSNWVAPSNNAWQAGNYFKASGSVSLVSNAAATLNVTGVQLEAGTVASPFERRDYGRELMMCYRYYQKLGNSSYATLGSGLQINTTSAAIAIPLLCAMRAAPTSTFASLIATDRAGFDAAVSDLTLAASTTNVYAAITFSTAGAGFRPILLAVANTTSGYVAFSAEL